MLSRILTELVFTALADFVLLDSSDAPGLSRILRRERSFFGDFPIATGSAPTCMDFRSILSVPNSLNIAWR